MATNLLRRGARRLLRTKARTKWFIAALAGLAVPAAAYAGHVIMHEPDGLEGFLTHIGFQPLKPPTTLYGPGSLYRVSVDGSFFQTVCTAEPDLLRDRQHTSAIETVDAKELENASYSVDAALSKALKAAFHDNRVESVAYSLTDASIVEISLEDNEQIFEALQQRPKCKEMIDNLLKAGEFVCQGQSALLATVKYEVKTRLGIELSDASEAEAALAKSAIEAKTKTTVATEGKTMKAGSALFYGVKLNPTCITLPSASQGMHLPANAFERILFTIRRDFSER
jgi:hypothetical protein